MTISPSGDQWTIRHGDQEATVVEVGGGLRTLTAGGRPVLAGYGDAEACRSGRGQLLMPWPNRVRDGRYAFGGTDHQLAITEPAHANASHGLVRWARWELAARDDSAVTVRTRLHPQPGWDGVLDLRVRYALAADGLRVTSTATNVGAATVPFGYGAHPYVALGDTPLAEVTLRIPGEREVLVDERLLPVATVPVRAETDFRTTRPLGSVVLDTAYTDLARDRADRRWEVRVGGLRDLGEVGVWGDESFGWAQVFTAQGADTGVAGTRGIAVEPMSCPADAFNSGDGLVVLAPGDSWSGTWGIRVGLPEA